MRTVVEEHSLDGRTPGFPQFCHTTIALAAIVCSVVGPPQAVLETPVVAIRQLENFLRLVFFVVARSASRKFVRRAAAISCIS